MLKGVVKTAEGEMAAVEWNVAASDNRDENGVEMTRRRVVYVDLTTSLQRDLFRLNPSQYNRNNLPNIRAKPINLAGRPTDTWIQTEMVSLECQRRLNLKSVMLGLRRRAVINGILLAPGKQIEGFTLLKMLDRQAVLDRDGIVIYLNM